MGENQIGIEGGDDHKENRLAKSGKRNVLLVQVLAVVAGVLALAVVGCVAGIAIQSTRQQSLSESRHNKGDPEAIGGPSRGTAATGNIPKTPGVKECKTKVCKDLAAEFQLSIDKEVDPCVDFYNFSCGGWIKRTEIPEDQEEETRSFGAIEKRIAISVKALLEEKVEHSDLEAVKKRKALYTSCMNVKAIESGGVRPLTDLFQSNNLSWPMMWHTEDKDIDIMAEAVRYAKIGLPSLIGLWILGNGGKRFIELDVLPPRHLDGWDDHRAAYINDTMAILKPNTNHTDAIAKMETYERDVAALMATYNGMQVKDTHKFVKVKDLYIATNYTYHIGAAVKEHMAQKDIGITLSDEAMVYIRNVKAFVELFMFVNGTKKTTIANELAFAGLERVTDYLPDTLRKIYNDYQKHLTGANPEPRFKTCVGITEYSASMPYATTRMYLDSYLTKTFKTKVNEIMDSILAQMMLLLSTTKWMDTKTRLRAVKKAALMTYDNAYPDWILNDTELNLEYQIVDMKNSNSPMDNFLMAAHATQANTMKLLTNDHPVSQFFPLVVNAFYEEYLNSIALTIGILLPPFYSEGAPKAVNYGSIGTVAAHEVTHAFDSKGREVDEKGNFFDWWTNESRINFDKGIECVLQQYNNYTITAINKTMDGRKTLSENIADIGSVNLAYAAYRNWVEEEGQEETILPDLDLSSDQLFFLSFATSSCQKVRVEYLEEWNKYSVHTLDQFRVHGSLQGNEQFAKAFGCRRGSRMNPGPQCPLW